MFDAKLELQLFSHRVLEVKHNSKPELYFKIIYSILVTKKKSNFFASFNEIAIYTNTLKENLKRFYTYKEAKERIPKFFFCRPFFTNYFISKLMARYREKAAQVFYNNNLAEEDKKEEKTNNKKKEKKYDFQIFNKRISEERENCDICTFVTSESDIKGVKNNNENEKFIDDLKEMLIE